MVAFFNRLGNEDKTGDFQSKWRQESLLGAGGEA